MPRFSSVRFEIWCEDRQHERFAREVLVCVGIDRRRMVFNVAPSGRGDASVWVRKQCGQVARRVSATSHQRGLRFLVVVDGDSGGSAERLKQIDTAMGLGGVDRVARWAPTWSIETWVLWLTGNRQVDESAPLKAQCDFNTGFRAAARAWQSPRADEASQVPSLASARNELVRVLGD